MDYEFDTLFDKIRNLDRRIAVFENAVRHMPNRGFYHHPGCVKYRGYDNCTCYVHFFIELKEQVKNETLP